MTKPTIAILMSKTTEADKWRDNEPTLRITAKFVKLEDGHIRNLSDSSYDDNEMPFADLQVTAFLDASSLRTDPTVRLWGNYPEFRSVFSVEARRARAMAATMNRIERGEAKLSERFGTPATFGERLARIADVLGVKTFLVWYTEPTGVWGDYDSGVFDTRDAASVIGWIANAEREFRKSVVTPETTTADTTDPWNDNASADADADDAATILDA